MVFLSSAMPCEAAPSLSPPTSVFGNQRRWRRHPKGGIYGPKFTKFPTEVTGGYKIGWLVGWLVDVRVMWCLVVDDVFIRGGWWDGCGWLVQLVVGC